MIAFRPVSKASTNKSYICQQYVYIVFIKKMSEGSKQLPNWLKITEISTVLIVVLLPFLAIALHESCTRKTVFWQVTYITKTISSQSNFTAQKDPVQNKFLYCQLSCHFSSWNSINNCSQVLWQINIGLYRFF